MKTIYDIFNKSPFSSLNEHGLKVEECINEVKPLVENFINGNFIEVGKAGKKISTLEHEADIIKNEVRENLPKSVFMPVSREDFLKLLHRQDNIADYCEDIAILLSMRNTVVIEPLKQDVLEFVDQVIETARMMMKITKSLHDLMETSFSGPKAKNVLTMIEDVGHLEWKSDTKKYKLVKKMFKYEDKIDPVSIVLFLKIFDVISGIADSSENASNALRLMVSK
ncbi:TIGR00153 family protein [Candidatus Marinamargulisbacteria bacterium SCGC AAA071-K20]|nr:TIGR00153 family protein [Candidatus Marinamargulisbacteria bacterium SCGC AAA071-K20]